MKIALAQLDTTVGDIPGNLERVRRAYREASERGAGLVLTPELSLIGYPPRDLLDQEDFVRANLKALSRLARETGNVGLVVGYAEPNRRRSGKPLYNAAALLHKGRCAVKRCKSLLPTYDVFDESRYFEPSTSNTPFRFLGRRLGLTICEDAWNDESFWGSRRYAVDPVRRQVRAGAGILLNISASPFEHGKVSLRHKLLKNHASVSRRPMFYCTQVGANDELIFDGNSMALDSRGRLLARAKAFEEDLVLADPDEKGAGASWKEPPEAEQVRAALVLGIRDYARKCGFRDALIGLSGGIDSAVTAALAVEALGAAHVTGVAMPSMHSSEGSVTDARALAENLGIRLLRVPVTGVYEAAVSALREPFRGTQPGLAEQNIQARARGLVLMSLSNKSGALVLATGNKSELSVGYCTLYGDMCGGLAPIADVPKTTVYALARLLNAERELIPRSSIEKPPSAELAPDQLDQDDLPDYGVLDSILRAYIEEGADASAIARRGHDPELVRDVLGRIDRSEHKRMQAPPCLKISAKAFGVGRRMPIARGRHR